MERIFPADISFAALWSAERIMKRYIAFAMRKIEPLTYSCQGYRR